MNRMKWIVFLLGIISLGACERPAPEPTTAVDTPVLTGTYEGVLPAADGPGIHTTITLQPNGKFEWRSEFVGEQNGIFEEAGDYAVTNEIVTFSFPDENQPRYAQVANGQARLLDQDKNVITGPLADLYILKKTK